MVVVVVVNRRFQSRINCRNLPLTKARAITTTRTLGQKLLCCLVLDESLSRVGRTFQEAQPNVQSPVGRSEVVCKVLWHHRTAIHGRCLYPVSTGDIPRGRYYAGRPTCRWPPAKSVRAEYLLEVRRRVIHTSHKIRTPKVEK